jgi:hypothetical protein
MASGRRTRAAAALGVAGMMATGLGACSSTSVLALSVGDCFASEDVVGSEISDLATVSCEEPHDAEIFASIELDEGEYPGADAVLAAAEDFCLPRFDEWAGISYLDSDLDVYPIYPTADSWNSQDDRTILCTAVAPEDVTGSLEGVGR